MQLYFPSQSSCIKLHSCNSQNMLTARCLVVKKKHLTKTTLTFTSEASASLIASIRFCREERPDAGSSRAHGEQRVNRSEDYCTDVCHTFLSVCSAHGDDERSSLQAPAAAAPLYLEGKETGCQKLTQLDEMREAF